MSVMAATSCGSWRDLAAGLGDFDKDGKADILWRNQVTGANKIWLMQGLTRTEQSSIPKIGDTRWQVQR